MQIADSPPAPLFTLIVGPTDEGREVGETKKELAERHKHRLRFWAELLERIKRKTKLHANISPGKDNWIGTGAGKFGLSFNYVIREHDVHIELYMNRGPLEENKEIFDQLYKHKKEIEKAFGGALEWQRLDGKKTCRVRKAFTTGGYRDEDRWSEIQDEMIDNMIRFEKTFKPYVMNINI